VIFKQYICISTSLVIFTFFSGCSSKQMNTAWSQTKMASYNAVTDPMTWAPLATAGVLYATDGDDKVTDYFMQNSWVNEKNDDIVRELNGLTTYATAILIHDENWETKAKRFSVEWSAFAVSRQTVNFLNKNVPKEAPSGSNMESIGSHHALSPFAGAAMTRRNVAQMDIPNWAGYSIIGANYMFATSSALGRVQTGGHSFADQLISVTLGNFIGLFFHDAFMLENTQVNISLSSEETYAGMTFKF